MEGVLAVWVTVAVILVILVPMIAIDKIMNFIELDESYGSPCSVEMSFGYDV